MYDTNSRVEKLIVTPISKASAKQRAGRAGRTKPGKVYRLYTEAYFEEKFADFGLPDLQKVDLAPVILRLKALGVDNVARFDYISAPPVEHMKQALEVSFCLRIKIVICKHMYFFWSFPRFCISSARLMTMLSSQRTLAHLWQSYRSSRCLLERYDHMLDYVV